MSNEPNSKVPDRAPLSLSESQSMELSNLFGYLLVAIRKHGLEPVSDTLRNLGYSDVTSFDEKTGRD
jgi:hypothetical protein